MPKPTIGRTVRFHARNGLEFAAIIAHVVDVERQIINLCVIDHDGSTDPAIEVEYSADREGRCWYWPTIEKES